MGHWVRVFEVGTYRLKNTVKPAIARATKETPINQAKNGDDLALLLML